MHPRVQDGVPEELRRAVQSALEPALNGLSPAEQKALLEELVGEMVPMTDDVVRYDALPVLGSMDYVHEALGGLPPTVLCRDWPQVIRIAQDLASGRGSSTGASGGGSLVSVWAGLALSTRALPCWQCGC